MGVKQQDIALARDMTFENIMHRKTATTHEGFSAMLNKNKEAQKVAVNAYFQHWDNKEAKTETEEDRAARTNDYASLTRQYYNLATDFYEYGWCQSFHFCRFGAREAFNAAIARHEHYLAHSIGIRKGQKVLDVGCGVGGPAREIAKFTGAYITGITINEYQVQRAEHYAAKDGLAGNLRFVQGDFMDLPFDEGTFDAVYAIEATVHAPSLEGVYSQVFKVLKPGGVFGVYEWVMTDAYDNGNLHHRQLRLDIEQGDGISNMVRADEALRAIKAAGFELIESEDLAERYQEGAEGSDPAPWYWPLDGSSWRYANTIGDLVGTIRMTRWGRWAAHNFMAALETLRLAPPGTKKTGDSLAKAAEALVLGGKERLFTPMFLMVARKPLETPETLL
ncbi:Delta(24)-sterol C-methyltransferase [Diaporthe australafricana]|uniref:Delta(24)-sterol C-methyltransferase n=1 Tax=Diaporthe australafricana TaxID=127596 RepID=A0ABR3VUS1_9PEZI